VIVLVLTGIWHPLPLALRHIVLAPLYRQLRRVARGGRGRICSWSGLSAGGRCAARLGRGAASVPDSAVSGYPQPRFHVARTRLGGRDAKPSLAEHAQIRLGVVVAPPHRRSPPFPVLLRALPGVDRPRSQEHAARPQPVVDAVKQRRLVAPRDMDDRIECDDHVEGRCGERDRGHRRLHEGGLRHVLPALLHLACRDIDTRDQEASGKSLCHGNAGAAPEVESCTAAREGPCCRVEQRLGHGIIRILTREVPVCHAVVAVPDRILVAHSPSLPMTLCSLS